jgi:hypothetical protein
MVHFNLIKRDLDILLECRLQHMRWTHTELSKKNHAHLIKRLSMYSSCTTRDRTTNTAKN